MGHIQKRRRGQSQDWRARYIAPDGRERSKSFARKIDAERFLAEIEVDKARGTWTDPALAEIDFGEWAATWMCTTTHLKPKTRRGYDSMLRNHILPTFGAVRICDIRPVAVRAWLSQLMAKGLSASSSRQAFHLFGSIMRAAVEDGRIPSSPCIGIKLPRLPQTEMAYLEPEQLRRLLDVTPANHRLFVEVLAIGGLRIGEAAALRKGRIDVARSRVTVAENVVDFAGELHFGSPKTHQTRTVTLPAFVITELADRTATLATDDALVFTGPRGGAIRYGNFYRRVWKPAVEAIGLPDIGVHALRHTCAALLIAQGAHPKAIQRHLGHRSITTTLDRYGHLFEDEHETLAAKVDLAYSAMLGHPDREDT